RLHAMQRLVSGHAATSKPEVGTSSAGRLPLNHAPAQTPTPIASLLTGTQVKCGSFKTRSCKSEKSESGMSEMKSTPALFNPSTTASIACASIGCCPYYTGSRSFVSNASTLDFRFRDRQVEFTRCIRCDYCGAGGFSSQSAG